MDVNMNNITRYIDFLIEKMGFYITLHGDMVSEPALSRYNFHLNPYCRYIKTACDEWETCVKNQNKIYKKCDSGFFFGTCHAGVSEFVYPVMVRNEIYGFISVSGYKDTHEAISEKKALHFASKYHISKLEILDMLNDYLTTDIPKIQTVDTIIHPLIIMLEQYFNTMVEYSDNCSNSLYTQILQYITTYHNQPLTMEKLSKEFNYSVSTLSHLFKKNSGLSISEYIEKLRLDEAKWLLRSSTLTIQEISDLLGFCNPAYFSTVFKKKYNISPKAYKTLKK